jgi:hypothetical protein
VQSRFENTKRLGGFWDADVTLVVKKGKKCSKTTVRRVNQSHNSALVDINLFGSKFG